MCGGSLGWMIRLPVETEVTRLARAFKKVPDRNWKRPGQCYPHNAPGGGAMRERRLALKVPDIQ